MTSAQRYVPYAFARDNAILLKPHGNKDAEVWISDATPLAALNEVMRVFPGKVKPIVVAPDKLTEAISKTYPSPKARRSRSSATSRASSTSRA